MRTLIVCPGRGSYSRETLGSLQGSVSEALARCDAARAAAGHPTVSELDADTTFRASRHVAGEHASLLTFACSLVDLEALAPDHEVVGVVGNSMGWYTALAAAGALPLDDAIRLVETMAWYQHRNVIGGQLLYPLTGDDWRIDPERLGVVEAALAEATAQGHVAEWSIHLGGHAVLGADAGGLEILTARLPPIDTGTRQFPLRLPFHSAFHTSLMAPTSQRAQTDLADLAFTAPRVPLIDGRGAVFRPRWADPAELASYTLGHQVFAPFDFTTAVRTAMRHCAPERVVLLGPGNALGGPVARILVGEGWSGLGTREAFAARQATEAPLLLSFGVAEQRARLVESHARATAS